MDHLLAASDADTKAIDSQSVRTTVCGGPRCDRQGITIKGVNIGGKAGHDVVVVEGLKAGAEMLCRVTEDNSTFRLVVLDDVPIGHKEFVMTKLYRSA